VGANYYMIDFENVQPQALHRLQPGAAKIKVFLGQNQSKLLLSLVQALQPFGTDAEYIQIQGSGPDAVDFHIAFYIGVLSAADLNGEFHIISKDKGFDPLVRHLTQLGISCRRLPEIPQTNSVAVEARTTTKSQPAAAPTPKPVTSPKKTTPAAKKVPASAKPPAAAKKVVAPSAPATAKKAIEHLKKMANRPAKLKSLRSMLQAWFKPELNEKATDAVIQSLTDSKKIRIEGTTVQYALG
jgi:hypothetical protein